MGSEMCIRDRAAVNEYLAMSGHTKGAMFRRIKGGNSRLTRLSTCRSITSLPRLRSDQQHITSVRIQPGQPLPLNHWRMVRYWSMCSRHWGMRILRRLRCMTGARRCTGIRLLCGFGMGEIAPLVKRIRSNLLFIFRLLYVIRN